jgi:hypothetical protein
MRVGRHRARWRDPFSFAGPGLAFSFVAEVNTGRLKVQQRRRDHTIPDTAPAAKKRLAVLIFIFGCHWPNGTLLKMG